MIFRYLFLILVFFSASSHFSSVESKESNSKDLDRDLIGTRWFLILFQGNSFEIEFVKDHELIVRYLRLGRGAKPSWARDGKKIELTLNNGYAVYKGRLISKTEIKGTAKNHHEEWSIPLKVDT